METVDQISHAASEAMFAQAVDLMPGGVNSPVRAFRAVGGTPVFFRKALGSRLYDVDGNSYVDYVASWGAIILGHADLVVVQAISQTAANGTSFGAPHEGEVRLAREVTERMPSVERVRFVNSGTEATMAAIRLARAATGRTLVLKFGGNYHGAVDNLLAKAGSGVATLSMPDSAGVPAIVTGTTLIARYNDLAHVAQVLDSHPEQVAAVLVEPVAGNMGLVPPEPGFLEGLRKLCDEHGALLVVDEVMTGFRVAAGGACERFAIQPDLVCMGKVIGGGLPVGAYGGRRDLMEMVAPVGPVYQAGTLSGNPLAMAAGYAAVTQLVPDVYDRLEATGARLENGLKLATEAAGVPAQVQRVGSMISVFFTELPVRDFADATTTNRELYARLFHALLNRGVYLPPSSLESWFLTAMHTDEDIDLTVDAFEDALREVRS
jgi:glutamate-1-semialdehyde 2,1-aminomutase